MPDAKGANHGIEGAIRIWQRIGTRFVKTNARIEAARKVDHRRREITPGSERATVGSCAGEASGAGRNIEQAHTRIHIRGIEQRRDSAVCHRGEKVIIAPGDTIMRIALEITEGIFVNLRRDHKCASRRFLRVAPFLFLGILSTSQQRRPAVQF